MSMTETEGMFKKLCTVLDKDKPVMIQTHDFPDHDAIGGAYALKKLLEQYGYTVEAGYGGLIQNISIKEFVDFLNFKMTEINEDQEYDGYQVIVVDAAPVKGLIKKLAGTLKAVIDHHPQRSRIKAPFVDIRDQIGASCSIIWSYWREAGQTADSITASALLEGIQIDTAFLTRKVTKLDLDAHYNLYLLGDQKEIQRIGKTAIKINQLGEIGKALMGYIRIGDFLLVEVEADYSSAILAVVADFLLWIQEIKFVVAIEVSGETYKLSARSRDPELDAGYIILQVTKGIGTGGGHANMAGGIIKAKKYPGKKAFLGMIAEQANRTAGKVKKESLWKRIFKH